MISPGCIEIIYSAIKSKLYHFFNSSLINIFSPDLIVYGGGIMEACGDLFLEKILDEVDKYCMPSIRSTVELKAAALHLKQLFGE